ncbi:MAG TPA: proteasome activator [Actinomycetota bacterium]|nr:proteasome activator [Actinomycetota bacterium]
MSDDPTRTNVEQQVVEAVPVESEAPAPSDGDAASASGEAITEPAKLLRIASMVRELLDETRQASLDEAGRSRLADVYQRAVVELREVLSADLQEELAGLAPPLEGVPTESEIRVAQAQLVGWLEGLFHGIQAAMFAQQAAARQQFEELRRRGLLSQNPQPPDEQGDQRSQRGQYL